MQPRNKSSGTGKYSYKGNMTVVLAEKAGTRNIPKNTVDVEQSGNIIKITNGIYWSTLPGFMFRAGERIFGWGFQFIKYILDENDKVIWKNERYQLEASKIEDEGKITQ